MIKQIIWLSFYACDNEFSANNNKKNIPGHIYANLT